MSRGLGDVYKRQQLDHGWDIITRSDILHLLVEGSS